MAMPVQRFFGLLATCSLLAGQLILFGVLGCKLPLQSSRPVGPNWVSYNAQNGQLVGNNINYLLDDGQDRMWVLSTLGVSRFYHGSPSIIKEPGGTSIRARCACVGADGSIWLGLYEGGVLRFNEFSNINPSRVYTTADGLFVGLILSITENQYTGEIWVGSLAGVGLFIPMINEGGVWEVFTMDNSTLPTDMVRSIAYDGMANSIWMGTHWGDVIVFNGDRRWQAPMTLPDPYNFPIVSIAIEYPSTVWFGKWEGVSSLNKTTYEWRHYNSENTQGKLPPGPVNIVLTDNQGTRWFGTNAGLVKFRDTTWTTYNRRIAPELPSDTIQALAYDMLGNLWIGTSNGLAVFNEAGTRF